MSSAPDASQSCAEHLEVPRRRRDDAHVPRHGLDDDRRRAPRRTARRRQRRFEVVVRRDDGVCRGTPGTPSWRDPERREARARSRAARRRGRGAARELSTVAPCEARARRIALIDASVPDETSRTRSTEAPRRRSPPRAPPPARSRRRTTRRAPRRLRPRRPVSGSACPKINGPHDMHPVQIAAAVDVLERAPPSARHEQRLVQPDGRASPALVS